MSRKRDTNWSRDEITVLLDSIMEITRLRAVDGKRTNSKEVFEYAAKKMGDNGHHSRAEREKCRTKWKKMKEEFTHAKRARQGDTRHKEAPGIQPFYDRMEEFINGNYDNISPHSTIVRRTSSLSNSNSTSISNGRPLSPEKRASARIAATHATTNGTSPNTNSNNNDNHHHDTSSLTASAAAVASAATTTTTTIVTRANTTTAPGNECPSPIHVTSNNSSTPPSRLSNSRLSTSSTNNSKNTSTTNSTSNSSANSASAAGSTTTTNNNTSTTSISTSQKPQTNSERATNGNSNGELCIYTAYNECPNSNSASTTGSSHVHSGSNDLISASPPEPADISYRVSSGCRQITIFGDHDVDIKFRRDRVTINKIEVDYHTTES